MDLNQRYLHDTSGEGSPSSMQNALRGMTESSFQRFCHTTKGSLASSQLASSPGIDDSTTHPKLSLRREIELRKAKQKEQDEANYTFKPTIQSNQKVRSHDPPGTPRENRFDKLYSDALKRHITTHLREETRDRDLTFTPKIHSRSTSRQNSRPSSRAKTRENSVERPARVPSAERDGKPLHERLSTPRRTKKELENSDLTFTPTISKRAKAIETLGSQEVAKRLYEHSKMIQEKLELKRNESELKTKETCPFSPQLVTKRSSSNQRGGGSVGVVDRSMRFEEEKQMRLEEARRQKDEEELAQITLKPTLIASKRPTTPSSRLPVHERLAVPLDKSVSPQVALAYSEYTFHPKLHTKRAPSPNRYSADYCNIHERLFQEGQNRQQEVAQERASLRLSMEQNMTFKPAINKNVQVKDTAPVFERLANHHSSPEKSQRVQEELTKEWTFSPALSHGTQKLTAAKDESASVFQRLIEDERIIREEAERRKKLKEDQEEEELRKLTFSPNLPSKSTEIAHASRIAENIDIYTRLNSTRTLSKSTSNVLLNDNSSQSGCLDEGKKIVKDEKELQHLFERLNATTIHHVEKSTSDTDVTRKVVLPKENVDAIFNRLRNSRTQSFILKYDSQEAEQILKQHSLLKGVPKIHSTDLDGVLHRLREHTLSSAASYDMKSLSRSSSCDLSVGAVGGGTGSPSALQLTLARRMSVTNKTFVDSLERSDSPLNIVPRCLSPMQANSRSSSPGSATVQSRNNATPPKRLAGLNVFEELRDDDSSHLSYLHRNHIGNGFHPSIHQLEDEHSREIQSFLDEPETVMEVEQGYSSSSTVNQNRLISVQDVEQPVNSYDSLPEITNVQTSSTCSSSGSNSRSSSPTSSRRLSNRSRSPMLEGVHSHDFPQVPAIVDFVYDQLPSPQLKSVNSVSAGLVMPPLPPVADTVANSASHQNWPQDGPDTVDLDGGFLPPNDGDEIFPAVCDSPVNVPQSSSFLPEDPPMEANSYHTNESAVDDSMHVVLKKGAKKAGFVPQVQNESHLDYDSTIVSVDESDDF